MPCVSVVLPVYNGEAYLAETLASVFAQTHGDFELIAVDDGSTDRTAAILALIADPRLKVVRQANRGLAASRNRGVAESGAGLIAFVDADDLWHPTKLAAQVAALGANPAAALAYGWTDYVDAGGRPIGEGSRTVACGRVLVPLLQRNFVASGSNPLLRRDAFEATGGFDESLAAAEDWDLWLRLAARYEFAGVAQVVVSYRVHAASMSARLLAQARATRLVLERGLTTLPASAASGAIARRSRSNVCAYLAARALEGSLSPWRCLVAASFGALYLLHDPALLLALPAVGARALAAGSPDGWRQGLRRSYRAYREARLIG